MAFLPPTGETKTDVKLIHGLLEAVLAGKRWKWLGRGVGSHVKRVELSLFGRVLKGNRRETTKKTKTTTPTASIRNQRSKIGFPDSSPCWPFQVIFLGRGNV